MARSGLDRRGLARTGQEWRGGHEAVEARAGARGWVGNDGGRAESDKAGGLGMARLGTTRQASDGAEWRDAAVEARKGRARHGETRTGRARSGQAGRSRSVLARREMAGRDKP